MWQVGGGALFCTAPLAHKSVNQFVSSVTPQLFYAGARGDMFFSRGGIVEQLRPTVVKHFSRKGAQHVFYTAARRPPPFRWKT